ncbi:MAG: ABC transporter permease [Gammaproteobacteria bacterium]|nr:ABC transporter permease [Gammaproteobacteria bacterium]
MFFLAIRHLLSRKRQTALIFLGISMGTMMFAIISGLQLGMREFVVDRLLSNTAHIRISARDQSVDKDEMTRRFYPQGEMISWLSPPSGKREEAHILYPQGWFDRLREDPEVVAYSPTLNMSVIISKADTRHPAVLVGVVPALYEKVLDISQYIQQGSLDVLKNSGNRVIVGNLLLESLGARLGDTIMVSSGQAELRPLKIAGVLSLSVEDVDKTLMIASLNDVQQLNKTPGQINEISVALVDINLAQAMAGAWALVSRDKVESWEEVNASFLQIFVFQDIVRITVTTAILVVAAFGIYNVLSIIVNQKRREIAILRSIGYPPSMILQLFLIQGVMLGFSGALFGLLVGFGLNLYIETIELNVHIGSGNTLIISFAPSIYIMGFAMAFFSAILASLLPALAASRLTPIDIIRSEI